MINSLNLSIKKKNYSLLQRKFVFKFNQTIVDCVYFLISSMDIKIIDFYTKPLQ